MKKNIYFYWQVIFCLLYLVGMLQKNRQKSTKKHVKKCIKIKKKNNVKKSIDIPDLLWYIYEASTNFRC